jgi:hypothetical protein
LQNLSTLKSKLRHRELILVLYDYGEKYASFVIEILIHECKKCLLDILWTQKIIKNPLDTTQTTFSENNNYYRVNIGENERFHC